MVTIAAGVYTPLYSNGREAARVAVNAFDLDTYAVTNAQYLTFVQANAWWRRSRVPRLFAEPVYLSHWPSDLPSPEASVAWLHSPVTSVSWFAARAYCAWQQKRLPSVAEWEYAALASDCAPDHRHDPAVMSRILEWYTRPTSPLLPPVGSGGQNSWGV
jgi:formylglycine-generating enzyme required for sulfatase activity